MDVTIIKLSIIRHERRIINIADIQLRVTANPKPTSILGLGGDPQKNAESTIAISVHFL